MKRTTVRLDDNLYKEARKKAIDDGVAFADVVNDALGVYLTGKERKEEKEKSDFHSLAGIWKDLDTDKMIRDIYKARRDGSRRKKYLAKW
jgi:hypothetical protein